MADFNGCVMKAYDYQYLLEQIDKLLREKPEFRYLRMEDTYHEMREHVRVSHEVVGNLSQDEATKLLSILPVEGRYLKRPFDPEYLHNKVRHSIFEQMVEATINCGCKEHGQV